MVQGERVADAPRLVDEAEAAVARVGRPAPLALELLALRSAVAQVENRRDEARALLERTLDGTRALYGEGSIEVGRAENNLGAFFLDANEHAGALPHFDRALAIEEPILGAHPPAVLEVRQNRANAFLVGGRANEAREAARDLARLEEEVSGPAHDRTAAALELYAATLMYEGLGHLRTP